MSKLATSLALLLVACGAPDDRPPGDRTPVAAATPAPQPVIQPATTPVAAATPAPQPVIQPATTPVHGAWRARIAAETAALRAEAPARHAELVALQPRPTRAGHLRFSTDFTDPRAASIFLDRLVHGGEPEGVRAALAEALPRTGGRYADAVAELIGQEPSAVVRTAYAHTARRAPAAFAERILARGLADASTEVQAEAARAAASHPAGARLADELRAALASSEPQLRAEAARALGILRITAARDQLVTGLADASAEVRLESLRAIDRIAPGSLDDHPALRTLMTDPDARISRLASKLAGVAVR